MAKTRTRTATPKVTLKPSRDIAFEKLVLSQANVRRTRAGESIEDLADSIARRGLLQGLNVRPMRDADGKETGMFEVPAGGRRFRALELLVKQKRMARTEPVPCIVVESDSAVPAEEDSLAENVQRVDLHPLDQFRAFAALREKGMGEEAIAARFYVPVSVVRQRLRLATVSETLLDVYAEDGMSLEQLMAFTVTTDHARQEQVWEALKTAWSREPNQIRRMLTQGAVRAADRRVLFVTLEAYEQAGGGVMHDLFENDDGGWLEDVGLLDKLVADKLEAARMTIAAEGWRWVEGAISMPYGHTYGLRRIAGRPAELTDEEAAEREALRAEQERLEAEYEDADELPEDIDTRLGEIETALAAFESRPAAYDEEERARAGAFVSIAHDGRLLVERGYVRPEDDAAEEQPEDAELGADTQSGAHGESAPENADPDDDDDGSAALPDRLLTELSVYRTVALADAVARHPRTALTLLLHRLVVDRFRRGMASGCLQVAVSEVPFPEQPAGLRDTAAALAVAARHEAWLAELPQDDGAIWDWLDRLDESSRMALLAHCLSFGVNALHQKPDRYGAGPSASMITRRTAEADRVAGILCLDMVEAGWRPTVENYLGRITKAGILNAVEDALGAEAAEPLGGLKKPDMARRAEELLADTGWLPEQLRTVVHAQPEDTAVGDAPVDVPDDGTAPAIAAE